MASIDRPKGKPRVRWTDPDGTPHAKTCTTEAAARDHLRAVQWCEDTGRIWKPESRIETPTLREIGERWIAAIDRRLAPRVVDRAAQITDAFFDWYDARHGQNAGPGWLSEAEMEAYWDHVRTPDTGRYIHRRTETTARKHMEEIHKLWEWASKREEYTDRTREGVYRPGYVPPPRPMTLPRRTAATPRPAPTWAEMDAAIGASSGWRRCALIVMRCTGLRVQQAMGLRWTDLADGRLTIRGELGKSDQEREGRVVPAPPALLEEWARPALAVWSDREWIVPCPHAHRTMRARDVAAIWRQTDAREAAWTGRPDHCFRAGYQTGLRAVGVARDSTEFLVGHAMPGVDVSYIDPEQVYHLAAAVSQVPPIRPVRPARPVVRKPRASAPYPRGFTFPLASVEATNAAIDALLLPGETDVDLAQRLGTTKKAIARVRREGATARRARKWGLVGLAFASARVSA